MIREILEESGLSIQNPKLCGLLMLPKFKGDDWHVFVFTATEFNGELIDSPEGKLEWIPHEKIPELNLWESDLIAGGSIRLTLILVSCGRPRSIYTQTTTTPIRNLFPAQGFSGLHTAYSPGRVESGEQGGADCQQECLREGRWVGLHL